VATKVPPHNDYTGTAALLKCAAKHHYPTVIDAKVALRSFVDAAPASDRGTAETISLVFRATKVGYAYDPATNTYLRSVAGKPQLDELNGHRVAPTNVVVLFQNFYQDPNQEPHYDRPVVVNVGKGNALVFMNGHAIKATWKKKTDTDLTRLYDSTGKEISLVRGQIFIQSLPTTATVHYN
jgi:hypothetical protein